MDLILCHTTADFDTLGAAVGLARLHPGAKIILTGGTHPAVQEFLALYRDEYPLLERRCVTPEQIHSLSVVDAQKRDRLGAAAQWLDQPQLEVAVYDHHLDRERDIAAAQVHIAAVGATTTLVVEQLQAQQVQLTVAEATVMALGIHVDTGSLTYGETTVRDAAALTWLMSQGASLSAIAQYTDPGLSETLQELLADALAQLQTETVHGHSVAWVLLTTKTYTPGLSHLAAHLLSLTESDSLLLANRYLTKSSGKERLTIIGRSNLAEIELNALFEPLGGGGHSRAAAATFSTSNAQAVLYQLVDQIKERIPQSPTAQALMSTPVRTIRPETTIDQAQQILLRYGHSGLPVVDAAGQLVGIISRRDLDIALHHGFGHAPVKGYMTHPVKTVTPSAPLPEIESLMVTYDIGRLPVLVQDQLVGIVTRTDILRQLHQLKQPQQGGRSGVTQVPIQEQLQERLNFQLQQILTDAAQQSQARGWQLYLVGGAVRDLLLTGRTGSVAIHEFDLVVDGVDLSTPEGAGVELARALQQKHPEAQLQVYGKFQTAALKWPEQSKIGAFNVDVATARTEFYPYPAANPEVEASSIRQDLYRRDFTINALAVRLTQSQATAETSSPVEKQHSLQVGELLDFFGGLQDLQQKQIRVLHPNSFIEDPTRIFRAVRFAVRLEFQLEPQTEQRIRHAIAQAEAGSGCPSGRGRREDHVSETDDRMQDRIQRTKGKAPALQTRLKNELKYILQAPYWEPALKWLADLGALKYIHPTLEPDSSLWRQLRLADRWFQYCGSRPGVNLMRWELLLEVLLTHLAPEYRAEAAENLHLSASSIKRSQRLAQIQAEVVAGLHACQRPSQISHLFSKQDFPTLILIAAQSPLDVRKAIWQYLTHWAHVKPLLSGDDLKALGYKPGRQFKQILAELRAATLDGVIHNRPEAEAFLTQHYSG